MKYLEQTFSGNDTCLLDVSAKSIEDLIPLVVDRMVGSGLLKAAHRDHVVKIFLEREQLVSTAIGNAVAVPHCYLDSLTEPQIVFVRLKHGINLGAPDGTPTRFFFFLLGSSGRASEHLDALSLIARVMSDGEFRYELGEAQNPTALRHALEHTIARTSPPVIPHAQQPDMASAKGFGAGIVQDWRRRITHYKSDFIDGLHPKSISATLFLLFACLAPAITFGGIMAELTDGQIGAVEMIVASAFCGVVYALFSGQPLIILGGTGPLLLFTVILYRMCLDLEIPFLETRAWVGLWTALFLLILSVTNASNLMRYFTRFTDEIFAALISIIFIYAAVKELVEIIISDVTADAATNHDAALVQLLLALGTCYIAMNLTAFRRSRYLLPRIREFFADFGPSIAICVMLAIKIFWFDDVTVKQLPAPDSLQPSIVERTWLLNLQAAPVWVWFGSIGPAILVTVLVYMDQNITARLVNSPDHKLHKGEAYHYDLAIMAGLIAICSVFGLPWLVAATVRSLNHVRSLATLEDVSLQSGETRERVIHVRETRITGLVIHLLIGCSLLFLADLKQIPMAILFGLFLFMGIVSMKGNQLFERLSLWIMDTSLYPRNHYTQRVPRKTMHIFTLLQLLCLAVLLVVEVSPVAILFPLFIALLVPVRLLLNRYFKPEHLAALDADEIPEEEETQW